MGLELIKRLACEFLSIGPDAWKNISGGVW